jgi:7-cyano-7-deazaguanine synthase
MGDMAGTAPPKQAPASEWWPFRNQLLITLAGAAAIADGVTRLMIGAIRTDAFHADSRAEFFRRISHLMVFQEGGVRVTAPAIEMDAIELVRASGIPAGILAWSHSCHVAPYACGACRGCAKHAETMKQLGYGDY